MTGYPQYGWRHSRSSTGHITHIEVGKLNSSGFLEQVITKYGPLNTSQVYWREHRKATDLVKKLNEVPLFALYLELEHKDDELHSRSNQAQR